MSGLPRAALAIGLALAAGPVVPPAAAQAPADSALHRFLGELADSTDRYFGPIAAPLDTFGLDSALAAGLERPWSDPRRQVHSSFRPAYAFNRVDGNVWGGSASLAPRRADWRLRAEAGYAAGPDRWLGGGELVAGRRLGGALWRLRVAGGRYTEDMDRDRGERSFQTLRALVAGSDLRNYLRRDGYTVGVSGEGDGWFAGLAYRDHLETPLRVATRWNLTRSALDRPDNLAAVPGRARELALTGDYRLPGMPLRVRLTQRTAGRALGSDFDYRRTRLVLGGELAAFGRLSFLPQVAYGRLSGDALPQAAFFLGGTRTLRARPGEALAGSGMAIARLEAIGADDLLALARIPHPAMFPLQGGVFVATGAVWGWDPYGGPGTSPGGWPERDAWRSEAGLSLLYRPGIPDEQAHLRVNLAWPIGVHAGGARWTLSYSRPLDLLDPH